jgi:hypothetical protein
MAHPRQDDDEHPESKTPLTRDQRMDAIARILLKGAERYLAEQEAEERARTEKKSA